MKNKESSCTVRVGVNALWGQCAGRAVSDASETSSGWTRQGFELDPWSGIKTGKAWEMCILEGSEPANL